MVYPAASTVPVPELIRRGYDRAKGLGHDGLDSVRASMHTHLAEARGQQEAELPAPLSLPEGARVMLAPRQLAAVWSGGGTTEALKAVMAVLAGGATLSLTHAMLKATVAALADAGQDVRTVTLWIAAMTVLPEWAAPLPEPPIGTQALEGEDRLVALSAAGAAATGPLELFAGQAALEAIPNVTLHLCDDTPLDSGDDPS